jgi:hypothetical protein
MGLVEFAVGNSASYKEAKRTSRLTASKTDEFTMSTIRICIVMCVIAAAWMTPQLKAVAQISISR